MTRADTAYRAMVLAAGEGTRLRPLTRNTPKVLLPIGTERPLIGYILSWLRNHGITKVAINLHHMGHKIQEFLGDGSRFGVEISYSPEETLLGTAGAVKKMEPFFPGTFIVVYGDVLTNFNLKDMIHFHHEKKAMATLAIMELAGARDVGVVKMDDKGKILSFIEKPPHIPGANSLINGGVYVLEKEILDNIPGGRAVDFAYDIFPELLRQGSPVYGYLLKPGDHLIDIGIIERYHEANRALKEYKVKMRYREYGQTS